MFHAKYPSSSSLDFLKEDFISFFFGFYGNQSSAWNFIL
jgi:hypothetical protein